jgi:hypothetical protein
MRFTALALPLLAALAAGGCGSQEGATPTSPELVAAAPVTPSISVSPNADPVVFETVSGPFDPNSGTRPPTTVTFTVTNTGTKSTSGISASITGTGAAAYSVRKGDNGCAGSLGTSASNNSCTVKVTFAPSAAGTYNATVNFSVAKAKGAVSVNITGLAAASIRVDYQVTAGPDTAAAFRTTGGLNPANFLLKNGQSQSYTGLAAGSYTLSFAMPIGYEFDPFATPSNWGCAWGGAGTSVDLDTQNVTANITLGADGLVICTFSVRQST